MHPATLRPHATDDTSIPTVDGLRFQLDDHARTVITRRLDGSVVPMSLAEFKQQRHTVAQALRQAEIERCGALLVRRFRLLRSTLKWRLRLALRALASQRGRRDSGGMAQRV